MTRGGGALDGATAGPYVPVLCESRLILMFGVCRVLCLVGSKRIVKAPSSACGARVSVCVFPWPFWLKPCVCRCYGTHAPSAMPQSAPIFLRPGAIVAHANDVSETDHAMSATSRTAGAQGGSGDALSGAFSAHGEARRAAFCTLQVNSLAAATAALSSRGRPGLAKRFRLGARSRGALAHPDEALAAEISDVAGALHTSDEPLAEADPHETQLPPWGLASLRDDCHLRRRSHPYPGERMRSQTSEVVKRLPGAAPMGGGMGTRGMSQAMSSGQRQVDMIIEAQVTKDRACDESNIFFEKHFKRSRTPAKNSEETIRGLVVCDCALASEVGERDRELTRQFNAELLALRERIRALENSFASESSSKPHRRG